MCVLRRKHKIDCRCRTQCLLRQRQILIARTICECGYRFLQLVFGLASLANVVRVLIAPNGHIGEVKDVGVRGELVVETGAASRAPGTMMEWGPENTTGTLWVANR